jgi:hypothetical protein
MGGRGGDAAATEATGVAAMETTGVPAFSNAVAAEKKSVGDITPESFERRYVTRGMPLVLTDVIAEWPAVYP